MVMCKKYAMKLNLVYILCCLSHDIDLAFIYLAIVLSTATKIPSVSSKGELTEWVEFIQIWL